MINEIFNDKFAKEYFETFFKTKKRFPQSLVFEGSDILSSYFFALELARILNCKKDKNNPYCACTNCKWIREGKHPSIITVTPIDFKDDNTKTVISLKQIQKITSMINEASDYHRFFIFSNAKIDSNVNLEKYNNSGFFTQTENWCPLPLDRKILQEESSNALLKAVEEAPDRASFVFLTNSKENIIPTIVSRSLSFKFPKKFEKTGGDVSSYFENYPNINIELALEYSKNFIENFPDLIFGLDSMQTYLFEKLKTNPLYKEFIFSDIKKIETAKKHIKALVFPKNAIDSLFISLSSEGRKAC